MHTKVINPYILYTIIPNNVIGGQANKTYIINIT